MVVFGLDTARRLFDRGDRFDVVYVEPDDGVDSGELRAALDAAVGEQNTVLDADQGPPEVAGVLNNALPMFTLIAVFALGIGAMLVYNTAALSIEERRRDLAIVSALGGTPRTLAATTLGEAAIVGAAGGVVGAVGGVIVAGPIVGSLSTYTERVAGIPLTVHMTWPGVVVAVALGLVVSVAAAVPPVRRALRADVASELSGRERRERCGRPRAGAGRRRLERGDGGVPRRGGRGHPRRRHRDVATGGRGTGLRAGHAHDHAGRGQARAPRPASARPPLGGSAADAARPSPT